jgi:beta-aspartyl-peptidase (threonine type)
MNLLTRKLSLASVGLACALSCAALAQSAPAAFPQPASAQHKWALVLHGGAGVIERSSMTPEAEANYRAGLKEALSAAANVLDKGGSALDAVEAAIKLLEDNPSFNAGRGAVFAADGTNQLDAAIMDGETMRADSVADVQRTRHPISLARAVMEQSPHVMLIGSGADEFAAHVYLEQVPPSFFFTEHLWQQLVRELEKDGSPIPPRPEGAPAPPAKPIAALERTDMHKYGTVGVVALDRRGNIAAGNLDRWHHGQALEPSRRLPHHRRGDLRFESVVCRFGNGHRRVFHPAHRGAHHLRSLQYKGMTLQAAADEVVQKDLSAIHGDGGVIALTPDGQLAWSFNTPGMFRAKLMEGATPQISLYRDEP